ncbi:MAG: PAS domain-containing sensor histidine kinase, partial [Chloroflexi bacterium]
MPIGLYRTTPDGRILDVNEAMVHMLRYPDKETLLQESVINLYVSANTRDDWKNQLSLRDEIYRLEVRLRRYDGTEIWAEDVARAVRDEQGDILFYDGSLQDITDRKEAEEALKRREYELQTIISHLPEGVLLLDGDHHIVMANPAAQKVLNLLVNEAQPKLELLGDTPLEVLENEAGQPWKEIKPADDKGSEMVFEATAVSLPGDAEKSHIGCIIVLRDVTEERQRQQYQAAQERLATVGQMAAGIAHDFNNIMAAVVLYAQLIRRTETLSPRYQRYITTIEEQANRAAELTRQMLDFSRRSVLSRQEMDILPFLKEIYKLLERTLPENINLHLEYDEEKLIINVDPTRFQQILMNLALNARDAMPQGGDLTIKASRLVVKQQTAAPMPNMPPGNWLMLTVQDTGQGIPEDHLPRIFEPFFTTKGPDRGTGLGLSQVYGIVKQHEGYIDVSSKVGVGTTFIIYLPISEFQESILLPAPTQKMFEGHGELILVIEDNVPARLALCEVLENAGYKTLAAGNGRDALTLFDESTQKISLVLSDL